VIRAIDYAHPVFTPAAVAAQKRWGEISGERRTHYCGAYWRWGFHEDGVWSALRVSRALGGRGPVDESEPVASRLAPEPLAQAA
jgi:predicted NAD/FAD-binding protein